MKWFLELSIFLLIVSILVTNTKKGFVHSVLGAAKVVISIAVTFCFGGRFSTFLDERIVGDRVFSYAYERLSSIYEGSAQAFDPSRIFERMPNWLRVLLESMGADSLLTGRDYPEFTRLEDAAHAFAQPISAFISDLLAYALVFAASMLIMSLLAFLLGKLVDLPVIRTFDRFLGFLLGVLSSVLYASVYAVLVFALLSLVEGAAHTFAFHDAFEQTVLFRWIYEHNLFRWIFGIG